MAYKLDQVTSYILALDEEEVNIIISALFAADESELATEIYDECFGDDECDAQTEQDETVDELISRIIREVFD